MLFLKSVVFFLLLFFNQRASARQGFENDLKKQQEEGGGEGGDVGEEEAVSASTAAKGRETTRKIQKAALDAWASSLKEEIDYNATRWALTMRKQPQNFFSYYTKTLSTLFATRGATVNFVLVGACDGTNDNTIRERFLPNPHWRGVFVEPVPINVADLKDYLAKNGLSNRSHVIHAAASDKCESPTVIFKIPKYEEKTPDAAHWLRREIGSLLSKEEKAGTSKLDKNWKTEEVKCITSSQVLTEWAEIMSKEKAAAAASSAALIKSNSGRRRKHANKDRAPVRRRPHVLKIDAEGHDYQVCATRVGDGGGGAYGCLCVCVCV